MVFVLQGTGVVVHEGKDYPLAPEVVVFVPGGDEHCFKNTGNSTLRFLCLVPLSGA
jgi:mannose-6-phosphate isomerase-like protein (cupin superfamily)